MLVNIDLLLENLQQSLLKFIKQIMASVKMILCITNLFVTVHILQYESSLSS